MGCHEDYMLLPNMCGRCTTSYTLSRNVCVSNRCLAIANCIACSTPGSPLTCTTCAANYNVSSTSKSRCRYVHCKIAFCKECAEDNLCFECVAGYEVNSSGYCSRITCRVSNCAFCLTKATCSSCAPNYKLIALQPNICFYQTCMDRCSLCVSPDTCLFCALNTVKYNGKCLQVCPASQAIPNCSQSYFDGTGCVCVGCAANYYLLDNLCYSGTCNAPYCAQCLQPDTCLKCAGFLVPSGPAAGNECLSTVCATGCAKCKAADPLACVLCRSAFVLNSVDSLCYYKFCADAGCVRCTDANNCLACTPGYYLVGDRCFNTACASPGCKTCPDPSTCQECQGTLVLLNNLCYRRLCRPTWDLCTLDFRLFRCLAGTTLVNGDCYYVNDGAIAHCQLRVATDRCEQCVSGYEWKGGQCFKVTCGVAGCQYCESDTTCAKCLAAYPNLMLPVGGSAYCYTQSCSIVGCNTCSSQGCITCNSGYYVNAGGCARCAQNCDVCSDGTTCQSCLPGSFLEPATLSCSACAILGCAKCEPRDACSSCLPAFSLISGLCYLNDCRRVMQNCVLCSKLDYCLRCQQPFVAVDGVCDCPPGK